MTSRLFFVGAACWLTIGDAAACGGFFCRNTPVVQSGEDIVYALDEATGTVEVHVQIEYSGAAEDFAWIVPIPEIPTLFLSTSALFDRLAISTPPVFVTTRVEENDCAENGGSGGWSSGGSGAGGAGGAGGSGTWGWTPPDPVVVLAESTVGPYETVTLQAQDSGALLNWLQNHDYDLPQSLDPVLAPYVADASYFVALRLRNEDTSGILAPLGMRYAGSVASIPIQLTSIAASPDMPLTVYVLGDNRAVPDNYLHVQINEAAVNWDSGGGNYADVVSRAADEAGGHAFATDLSGSTDFMRGTIYVEGQFDTVALAQLTDPVAFMDAVISQGFTSDDTLLALLRVYIPMPAQLVGYLDENSFYNDLGRWSYELENQPFDPVAFAADIETIIVEPRRAADALFATHNTLTRMTSSLSPTEMTLDPFFVLNPDVSPVERTRYASLVYECGDRAYQRESAERRVELSDGRVIELPSEWWLSEEGMTLDEYLLGTIEHAALVIEDMSASGEPEVLVDFGRDAPEVTNRPGDYRGKPAETCGCSTPAPSGGLAWGLVLVSLAIRRGRRTPEAVARAAARSGSCPPQQ